MAETRLVEGNRGGSALIHEGYKYHKNRKRGDSIYWRCWRKDCRKSLKTNNFLDNGIDIDVIAAEEHEHDEDDVIITRQGIINEIRRDVEENPTVPTKRTYDHTIARIRRQGRQGGGDRAREIPEYHNVRAQMDRRKRKFVPDIPHGIEDVEINDEWAETWQGDRNLLHLDNDWGVAIFGTDDDIDIMRQARTIYVDGTFKTAPHPYAQLFTVHAEVNARVLYCASALLMDKTIGSYRQVFQCLKRKVRQNHGQDFRPRNAVSDFEQALITAMETEFPRTRLRGCYFHFTQSLWRKVQRLGLTRAYRVDVALKRNIRKTFAMGYLPIQIVRMNFNELFNSQETRQLMNQYPNLRDYYVYLRNNYFDGNFAPHLWNVYNRRMDFRTNNHVESFHNSWNKAVNVRHPSLWNFIRVLKDQLVVNEAKKNGMLNGNPPPARKLKWRRLEERIVRLKREYGRGQRDIMAYWNAICHCTAQYAA